jgi:DNA-binding response OmpR family regulator
LSRPKVLVVEDEEALAKVLKLRLEIEGFAVRSAGDGREALEQIAAERPDIVVCDLMMPVMDGKAFTKAVKSDRKLRSIPILILSALKRQQEVDELTKLGADGFVAKPFDSTELTARIRSLLKA